MSLILLTHFPLGGVVSNSNVYSPIGATAVFFGDSITVGPNTTGRWTKRVCNAKGWVEDNRGVSGMVGTEGAMPTPCSRQYFNNSNIPAFVASTHSYLFISFGVNDVGVNIAQISPITYGASLQNHINAAKTKGWPIGAIVLVTPFWNYGYNGWLNDCGVTQVWNEARLDSFAAKNAEIATSNGCKSIDIYNQMKNYADRESLLAGDAWHIHPNENPGHVFIANYVASQFS